MYLAWNTQKNKMTDVKGKEYEQEREGEIKNNEIDSERTHLNYDLIQSDKTLYRRVKERVDELKNSGSRVQKNSVVTYSNILTVPADEAEKWGEEKTADYFKACTEYFQERFGEENVVSAKVHLDETAPHMHLHFLPVSKETGKLQARSVMNKKGLNDIHNELPAFLQERGFDVTRGTGEATKQRGGNVTDVHKFKEIEHEKSVLDERRAHLQSIEKELNEYDSTLSQKKYDLESVEMSVEDELSVLDMRKAELTQTEQSIDKRLDDVEEKETQAQQKFVRAMQRERETLQMQENLRKREEELEEKEKMYEEKVANLAEREQQLDEKISVIKISERILNNRKEKFEQDKEQTIQQILSLPDNPHERLILKESRRNESGQKIARNKTITSQKAQQNIANNFANKQRNNNDGPEL